MDDFDSFGFGKSSFVKKDESTTFNKGNGRTSMGLNIENSERCLPSTISMIVNSLMGENNGNKTEKNDNNKSNEKNELILHGYNVAAVIITGWIESVKTYTTRMELLLADGTGIIRVFFDYEDKRGLSDTCDNVKPGKLIRVVGSIRPISTNNLKSENNSQNDENDGENMDKSQNHQDDENTTNENYDQNNRNNIKKQYLSMDACHFKIIEQDLDEYLSFPPTEIVYSFTKLKKQTEQVSNNNENNPKISSNIKKEDWEKNWHAEKSLDHLIDPVQCDIIRILKCHPSGRTAGVQKEDFYKVLDAHDGNDIEEALTMLQNEGEILECDGRFSITL